MANPNTRTALKEYCLRKLGKPVLDINVADEQIEDCIDDALQVFQEFHSDASIRTYVSHQVTADDVTNRYIQLSNDIHAVVRLLPFDQSSLGLGGGMFSVKYQMHLNDLANMNSFVGSIQYYNQIGQYLEMIDMVLTGTPQVEFQRYGNKLHIFGEWWDQEIKEGDWLVAEVYQILGPDSNTSIYDNRFLKDYTTALIKHQWGMNMSKFEGMQLPGGVTINARQLIDDAKQELIDLKENMRLEYEDPPHFFVG